MSLREEIQLRFWRCVLLCVLAIVGLSVTTVLFFRYPGLQRTPMGGWLQPVVSLSLICLGVAGGLSLVGCRLETQLMREGRAITGVVLRSRVDRNLILAIALIFLAQLTLLIYPSLEGLGFPSLPLPPYIVALFVSVLGHRFAYEAEKASNLVFQQPVVFGAGYCPSCYYPTKGLSGVSEDTAIVQCPECGSWAALKDFTMPERPPTSIEWAVKFRDLTRKKQRYVDFWKIFSRYYGALRVLFCLSLVSLLLIEVLGVSSLNLTTTKLIYWHILYGVMIYTFVNALGIAVRRLIDRAELGLHQMILEEHVALAAGGSKS